MLPLLDVRHLTIAFPTQNRVGAGDALSLPAVRDLSFWIAPGEVLGLVGEVRIGRIDHISLAIMRVSRYRRRLESAGEIFFAENGVSREIWRPWTTTLCDSCADRTSR